MPEICGIHHLKFPVHDLAASLAFYERAFGARRIEAFDHRTADGTLYAFILDVPHLGTHLELRLHPEAAAAQERFDPVTLSVRTRADLETWTEHLDALGVPHSPILNGVVGCLVVLDDPDGRRLRLYSLERLAPGTPPTTDSPWLR
jgi:catechol 2,3-dioxygenase-like lactoylglutathione lyase family enzyme